MPPGGHGESRGSLGQGTGPLCTVGGSPDRVSHWERSDLWRGQSPMGSRGVTPCKVHFAEMVYLLHHFDNGCV